MRNTVARFHHVAPSSSVRRTEIFPNRPCTTHGIAPCTAAHPRAALGDILRMYSSSSRAHKTRSHRKVYSDVCTCRGDIFDLRNNICSNFCQYHDYIFACLHKPYIDISVCRVYKTTTLRKVYIVALFFRVCRKLIRRTACNNFSFYRVCKTTNLHTVYIRLYVCRVNKYHVHYIPCIDTYISRADSM